MPETFGYPLSSVHAERDEGEVVKPDKREHVSQNKSAHGGDTSETDSEVQCTWYYLHRGVPYGPVCTADLRAAAQLGFIHRDDLISRADSRQWTPAHFFHWLFQP